MINALHTALAGMRASAQRIAVAGENVANVRSGGTLEPYDGYVPKHVVQETSPGGQPVARVVSAAAAVRPAWVPGHPAADGDGLIGVPDVSLAREAVNLKIAQRSYQASLAVLDTTNELMSVLVERDA